MFDIDVLDFTDEPSSTRWVIRSYNLADALHCERNGYRQNSWAERQVRDYVTVVDPDLYARLHFDSEMGCFFAYAATKDDADALVAHIEYLVESANMPGVF